MQSSKTTLGRQAITTNIVPFLIRTLRHKIVSRAQEQITSRDSSFPFTVCSRRVLQANVQCNEINQVDKIITRPAAAILFYELSHLLKNLDDLMGAHEH